MFKAYFIVNQIKKLFQTLETTVLKSRLSISFDGTFALLIINWCDMCNFSKTGPKIRNKELKNTIGGHVRLVAIENQIRNFIRGTGTCIKKPYVFDAEINVFKKTLGDSLG